MNTSKNIVKVALKHTIIYIFLLVLLSIIISYLTYLISMNIKYAIDGILFSNYNEIPIYINKLMKQNYKTDLLIISSIIILLNLMEKVLKYFRNRITTKFKLKININLKSMLYKHVLNLEYESYNSYDKTEMMQRIDEDADVYSNFFNTQFNVILDIIFLSIFILNEGVTLNIEISVYIFLTIILMLLFSVLYFKRLGIKIDNMIKKRKKLLNTTINNINNDYCTEEISFIKLVLFYDVILEHLSYLTTPILYIIGGIAIIKGQMTMGTLVAFNTLATKILGYIHTFGENLEVIDNFQIVNKKINELLKLKEENIKNTLYNLNGRIIFSNVSIYIDNTIILKNINFIIEKGERIAIIGENRKWKKYNCKNNIRIL